MRQLAGYLIGVALGLGGCGTGITSLTVDTTPACALETIAGGGNCGCDLLLPVDTTLLTGPNLLWPFGIHGGGHPEGHRGWDFLSNVVQDVIAPDDAIIVKFDDSVKDEDPLGTAPYLKLKCGIVMSFQPMRPDPSLVVSSRVRRGQKLGTLSPVIFGGYSLHIDTRVSAEVSTEGSICPIPFFNADRLAAMATLLAMASFNEKIAHTVNVSCADGTTSPIAFPAEPELCNARASAANAAALAACMSPASITNTGIW